ncbi:hypothetical protein EJB05_39464, partial [Eragrostis curvula]
MSKSQESTIEVKLFVDKKKKKVLFAESDKEFVDVLFSFLTIPLGTIVRLLDKQSQMGSLDEIYKSVEDLSADAFQTKACKAMLLRPLNAASGHFSSLKINIDDTRPRAAYVCINMNCRAPGDRVFSSFPDAVCKCGKTMQYVGNVSEDDGNLAPAGEDLDTGVFVKGLMRFIITDDLVVAPASTNLMLSLLQQFGVRDPEKLEETIVQLSSQQITGLLKRSLMSKHPLTELYFDIATTNDDADLYVLPKQLYPEQVSDGDQKLNSVKIKILQKKNNSSLLYVEAGAEFIDLLFGLLSIPLGSIIKAYGQWPSNGCTDNLWKSVDGNAKGCMRPERESLLVAPKSAPFGCGATKILQVDELDPTLDINCCFKCFKTCGFAKLGRCHEKTRFSTYMYCQEMVKSTKLYELNPKLPKDGRGNGETYMKGEQLKFMVTDDLRVLPLSVSTTIQFVSDAKMKMEELLEREITPTKFQVMEIQKAALISRNALSSVLLIPDKKIKAER